MSPTLNRLIIADSEHCADLLWATRFFVPDPVFYMEVRGKKILIVSDLELSRAKKEARVHQVLSLSWYLKKLQRAGKPKVTSLDILDAVLRERRVRKLTVPSYLGIKEANFLRKRGYRLEIQDPFFPERALKTQEEKKQITASLRATEAGISEAIAALRKSRIKQGKIYYQGKILTSERLKSIINVKMMSLGFVGHKTIVAGGKQGADPHCTGYGPLPAHQPIVIDVFPRSEKTGYFGDITRTVLKGKASPQLKKMYQAVRAAQENGIKAIHHGVDAATVHARVQQTLDAAGFKTTNNGKPEGFIHSTGHGLGLDIHEFPRVSKLKETLKVGHVVTVEPGLYYQKLGGIRIEDVVYVTAKGCEVLTKIPKIFEIL